MRILLAHNSPYYPAHGGGDKSNRLLMEALAARGHEARVVARTAHYGEEEDTRYREELRSRGVEGSPAEAGTVAFRLGGVEIRVLTSHPHLRAYFAGELASFAPEIVLSSTDDPAQLLLEPALDSPARVVYLARATLALPFGPDCAFPSQTKTGRLRRTDAQVGVSQYVADYLRRWGDLEAVHVPISLMEPGVPPDLGRFDNPFVTLVNPCAVKGISIFVALAEKLPEVEFAAVPTWGTTQQDREALGWLANVHVLQPVDRIDDLLRQTRVLLAPSLWAEARSRIVVEAMLRGVPVLAANVGGLPEAMMGVDYLLPVRPIEKYQTSVDEQMVPVAEAPPQDIGPWQDTLAGLLGDRGRYQELSRQSRRVALEYAGRLSVAPFEKLLERTLQRPKKAVAAPAERPASPLDALSPEKRRLLALRLQKKTGPPAREHWFPSAGMPPEARLRLFCFPHAGGGAAAFVRWREHLPASVWPCPARLPGREARQSEAPLRRMEPLLDALEAAIAPQLGRPFAFFGHSMGAVVAFELARRLRAAGRPLPTLLIASAARAPQFRRGWVAPEDPSEAEFLEQLERLEGLPREIRENPDLLRLVLPAVSADAGIYRHYVYRDEPPLACPIAALWGGRDPNLEPRHIEAWRDQTTAGFATHRFAGGHFYFAEEAGPFFAVLSSLLEV